MSAYTIAWLVILLSTLAGTALLYRFLRRLQKPLVRAILAAMVVAFFLVPAPVPGYEAQLAPAFVVCIFEAFLQIDGKPETSFRILLFALGMAALLAWFGRYLLVRYQARS